jgi:hypothetical protein
VIAGPSFMHAARAGPFEVADDIAVRIQYANFGKATSVNRLCLRASLNRASGRNTPGGPCRRRSAKRCARGQCSRR